MNPSKPNDDHHGPRHLVVVQETERGTKEPMNVEHVDTSSSVEHKGWIHTTYSWIIWCFNKVLSA